MRALVLNLIFVYIFFLNSLVKNTLIELIRKKENTHITLHFGCIARIGVIVAYIVNQLNKCKCTCL